jgi:SAM-dependent methyltransferase
MPELEQSRPPARSQPLFCGVIVSEYDAIADVYDEWIAAGVDDIDFYVAEAERSGGPVVEFGVGTGRVAIPIARAGIRVIGVDASQQMLAICRRRAEDEGLLDLLDLRLGDFRQPPVDEQVPLVTAPFRSLSHLLDEPSRRRALDAAHGLLAPAGRLIFDVATPEPEQVKPSSETWEERPSGGWERAEWDWEKRLLNLAIRKDPTGESGETLLQLAWVTRDEWRKTLQDVAFEILACYGWFDRRPCAPGGHTIWVAAKAS